MHRRSHELWLSRFVSQARAPEVLKEPIPGCADRLGHYNLFLLLLYFNLALFSNPRSDSPEKGGVTL